MIDGFPTADDPTRDAASKKNVADLAKRVSVLEASLAQVARDRDAARAEAFALRGIIDRVRKLNPRAYHAPELCGAGGYERESLNHGPECNGFFDGVTAAHEALDTDRKTESP
jgi:hypothetical protein